MRSLKVIGKAFVDLYDNLFVLLLCNVVYVVLIAVPVTGLISLFDAMLRAPEETPAAPVVGLVLALLWVLLGSPPAYALAVVQRGVVEFEAFTFREFLGAMRGNLRRAWLMGLVGIGGTVLLLLNMVFYASIGGWGALFLPLFLILTVLWLLMQMYLFPVAVITEGGPLRVLRNSAIIVVRHPGLTLLTGLVSAILIVASSLLVIPWVMVTLAALGALGTRAVRSAVRRDYGLPEEDPLSEEPLPPITAGDDDIKNLPHYGWRAGRRDARDEALARDEAQALDASAPAARELETPAPVERNSSAER